MSPLNALVLICLAYVALLFVVAAAAENRAKAGKIEFLRSPVVYTLSISVYCTAWTFYGAVGSAARNGLEFLAIYLGPTLVFVGWWWMLRKLVRIGRTQRITSIADLISSRYGKSNTLGVIVTILAVVGSTPYIALQLQSLTLSFSVFNETPGGAPSPAFTAGLMAAGLSLFTVIFGTRNLDANERHHGVVTAIALEAVVKLIALLSVGVFVVWFMGDGLGDAFERVEARIPHATDVFAPRWVTLTFLSATAIICLPRMFQVVVVENSAERHLATASWAFPLYLLLMCIFVLPIAATGLDVMPTGSNPDLFVLTVPLSQGQDGLAALAFLGGFSSSTSMVIVAAIALSTMVSNHIVLPVWLARSRRMGVERDDVRAILLNSRRISIGAILALGYLYYVFTGGTTALASIGLIAFLGVAQVLPAMMGGLFWRDATRMGAMCGIGVGFVVWAYTLFLPSFEGGFILSAAAIESGPWGIAALRPYALFGMSIDDPLIHAVFWSIGLNSAVFVGVSLLTEPRPLERLQAVQFTGVFGAVSSSARREPFASSEDLFALAQRVLGPQSAKRVFDRAAETQGKPAGLPEPDGDFIEALEREFAGSVGAATAHAMISQVTGTEGVSFDELIAVADEAAQIMEYSTRLEAQSEALAETARQLRAANDKLTELGRQKDDFLSQVSHELRTPMTSILSFSEILRSADMVEPAQLQRFSTIIHEESLRLTRLLDEILDLSFLESGRIRLNIAPTSLGRVVRQAQTATQKIAADRNARIEVANNVDLIRLDTDVDRLSQVFINLISNSVKYAGDSAPVIRINARQRADRIVVSVVDNGPGISPEDQQVIFGKFARLPSKTDEPGVGLGLPISLEIMRNLGGDLTCVNRPQGAEFRLTLPAAQAQAAE